MSDTVFTYIDGTTSTSSATTISATSYLSSPALRHVSIGSVVTGLAVDAFANKTQLETVIFNNPFTGLTRANFAGCTALYSCILPANLVSISRGCFQNCSSLASINIPATVTTINATAFYGTAFTSFIMPNSVTFLDVQAFGFCPNLTSFTFGTGLTSIPKNTFYFCNQLPSITIPSIITTLGDGAFFNCPALATINFKNQNTLTSAFSNAFQTGRTAGTTINFYNTASQSNLSTVAATGITWPSPRTFNYILGPEINTFGYSDGTFANFTGTSITSTSYNTAKTLTSVFVGSISTSITNSSFVGKTSLTSVTFSSSATISSIGNEVFRNTGLSTITIPNTVTSIGTDLFYDCTGLISCTLSANLTSVPTNTFNGCTSLSTFTLPTISTFTTIGDSVFNNCSSLYSVTIPDSVTTIGTNLFNGCTDLISCTLSDLLTSIPNYTFYGCSNLIFIEIPPNVTTINAFSFDGCSSLDTIVFDDASSANNKLTNVEPNSGFSTVNSLGTPPYPTVTFYNAPTSSDLTTAAQNIIWPASTSLTYNGGASCFAKGTKILCLNKNGEEEYIPIEKLRKGDLVKSYLHGYRKVDLIGKGYSVSDTNKFTECMYKMVRTETNGLVEDLIVTGGHSILVDDLGDYTEETIQKFGGAVQKIDDKYLLLAGISKDFEKLETVKTYHYYQLILENNGDNKERFGIWANGVLVETSTKEHFLTHPYIILN